MVISINGEEKTYTGNFVPENASFFDIINSLSYKNESVIRDWAEKKLSPIKVTSQIDLQYIVGNKTLGQLVKEFNRSTSRAYNPIALNVKILAERINTLGEPTILHLNSDIVVNDSSIPKINIFNSGDDLLVFKSNNIVDIYNTMLEYFYTKTIGQNKTKLATLGKRIQEILRLNPNKDIEVQFTVESLIHDILHNPDMGKILDRTPGNGFNTAREEIFALMEDLTKEFNKTSLKQPNKRKAQKFDKKQKIDVQIPINGVVKTITTNGYNVNYDIAKFLTDAYYQIHKDEMPNFPKSYPATMFKSYFNHKRPGMKWNTTFEAVIAGDRTSTTRFEGQGTFKTFWDKRKVGDVIQFRNTEEKTGDTEYVYVMITGVRDITAAMANDPTFVQDWSDREGWSKEYFETEVKPKLDKGRVKQITYTVIDPRYTGEALEKRKSIQQQAEDLVEKVIVGDEKLEQYINEFLNLC